MAERVKFTSSTLAAWDRFKAFQPANLSSDSQLEAGSNGV